MKKLNARFWWSLVGALVAIAVAVVFFVVEGSRAFIPDEIGEMKLAQQFSGEAAQGMIDHLHGKGVTPRENFIGFYSRRDGFQEGNGVQATLYVSVYADAAEAHEADRKMAQRIQAGNPVFGSYEEVNIAGHTVSVCVGMGQVHYFFSRADRLYWFGVDTPAAHRAAESLLNTVGR